MDCPGKLVKVDIDASHFELVISQIQAKEGHYSGTILVSDLQSRKCVTYRIGDHWSRLESIVGITRCDAFLVSKWLNSFGDIDRLLKIEKVSMTYDLTANDREEAASYGFGLLKG
jgi:hypothetical protein